MFKIVRIPSVVKSFFSSLTGEFRCNHASYFQALVVAIAASWGRRNVANLYRYIDAITHRTRFNSFLNVGRWVPAALLQKKARQLLRRVGVGPGQTVYLIIDDSHNRKRGKKMEAVGFFRDGVTGHTVLSHQFVSAILRVGELTVPWAIRLYVKKEACDRLGVPFKKTTELAAELIREFNPPKHVRVVVLFDSYYLCLPVVRACRGQGFHFLSVLKSNRNLFKGGRQLKAGRYIANRMRRGNKQSVRAQKSTYQVVDANWLDLAGSGTVHLVCSRRVGERKVIGIVTDAPKMVATAIVRCYAQRWSIEQFFKDLKQLLGLGQYQNGSYRAVVTHLHLVCFAYALLTHLRIQRHGAKGKRNTKTANSLSTASMQNELRRGLFLELVAHLKEAHPSGDSVVKELERLLVP